MQPPASSVHGKATHFLANCDRPYLVIGYSHNQPNLLRLERQFIKDTLPVINTEKVVVVDASDTFQIPDTAVVDSEEECANTGQPVPQSELAIVAFHFGKYLLQCSHYTFWYQKLVSLFIRSIPVYRR